MSRVIPTLLLLSISLTILTGCQGTPTIAEEDRPPPLLLISIDGFRYDYWDLAELPALHRLTEGGLKADGLLHGFPTKTFPTHYTMVTGRHPGTHGVVANSMWDPPRDARFSLRDRDAVGDGYWYSGGEPIWVTAESQGLRAGTFFWPGSEARIHGVRPSDWRLYSRDVPHLERVETILEWMDKPAEERPSLLTLYFSAVDSMGHRHGPRAEPVRDALIDVDHHLGILFDGLDERGLLDDMHIILVSDHGMSRVDFDRYIMLDDYLDLSKVRVSDWGPAAQIWATDKDVDDIVAALDGAHPNMRVWARDDIPARYRFGSHHRVPDVLAEADLEWMISNRPHMAGRRQFSLYGMHGWDPALREMQGGLVMHGPAFAPGSRSPTMRAVDLYALMAHLLELEPAEHEGSLAAFRPFLHASEPHSVETRHYDCAGETLTVHVGPAHAALHWGDFVHVLDRVETETGERFEEVDLMFVSDNGRARAVIDQTELASCQLRP